MEENSTHQVQQLVEHFLRDICQLYGRDPSNDLKTDELLDTLRMGDLTLVITFPSCNICEKLTYPGRLAKKLKLSYKGYDKPLICVEDLKRN